MARLICLGGGVESVPMIRRVQEMGHEAMVVDYNTECAARPIADWYVQGSAYHANSAGPMLQASGLTFDGVLCCGVDAPVACAEIAAAFGLPGLNVEAARLGQNKGAQKWTLQQARVPVPWFSAWDGDPDNLPRWAGVVKPVDSRGGRGVIRLLPDVNRHLAYEHARAQSPGGQVLVEEWLDGPQLSTESIVQDGHVLATGIGLRNYRRLDEFAPYVIEDGIDTPDELLKPWAREVDRVIEHAAAALGWYQTGAGIVKGDLVVHDGRVVVIELACRLSGGFFATHSLGLAYDLDLVGAAIQAALGERLTIAPPAFRQYVCQRYVFPSREDIGKTVVCIDEYHGPEFHTYNLAISDVVKPVTCHPARWGQVIATGASAAEAQTTAEDAAAWMYAGVILA